WDALDAALDEEGEFLRRYAAERGVQTNEVQRCWVLLPCFLRVAERTGADVFDLVELGPSAGFNLYWDRYRYAYAADAWGPSDALLSLTGEERGQVPQALLERTPSVRRRVGVDLDPVDVTA